MPIQIIEADKAVLEFKIEGKLDKQDYQRFLPQVERLLDSGQRLAMIIHVGDFSGWTPSALWEDLKFDAKHYSDIFRLALVADNDAKRWLATLSKPFTKAEVAFYRENDIDQARQWAKAA